MNEIIKSDNSHTMTSHEIAELVESRHDKVKQSIERLAERGAIHLPPMAEYKINGSPIRGIVGKEYRIGKRDSYVIVAQLSPEFTARLVDRWQELEAAATPAPVVMRPRRCFCKTRRFWSPSKAGRRRWNRCR